MSQRSESLPALLKENLHRVQTRIAAACDRAGRSPTSVQLVAVTKSAPLSVIEALVCCGQTILGENRPQQLLERAAGLCLSMPEMPLQWHLIGPLQSNKIRSVLPRVGMIHSVESLPQLQRIGRIAGELSLIPNLLLQVNVSGEESKGGFDPRQLRADWGRLCEVAHVQISGMMTMAPLTEDPDTIRETFGGLRKLRDELQATSPSHSLRELSMGMSNDFEIAIEEGATLVRVGSLLFEGCPPA